jgi:hypothetical protein
MSKLDKLEGTPIYSHCSAESCKIHSSYFVVCQNRLMDAGVMALKTNVETSASLACQN